MANYHRRHLEALHEVRNQMIALQDRIAELQFSTIQVQTHLASVLGASPAPDALDSAGQLAATGEALADSYRAIDASLEALGAHMRNI